MNADGGGTFDKWNLVLLYRLFAKDGAGTDSVNKKEAINSLVVIVYSPCELSFDFITRTVNGFFSDGVSSSSSLWWRRRYGSSGYH